MSDRGVWKKGDLYKALIRVFDIDGVTPKTGLTNGDFTKLLLLDGVSDATSVTVTEAAVAGGYYVVSYTPAVDGWFFLNVSNPTYAPKGFDDELQVYDATFAPLANLDVPVSSRADASIWTAGVAATLDAAISTRASAAQAAAIDADVLTRAAPGDAMALAAAAIDAAQITAAAGNKLADHALRRKLANARVSSNGDALDKRTLLGASSVQTNKKSFVGSQLLIFDETDAGSPFLTFNGTATPGADPITSLVPA